MYFGAVLALNDSELKIPPEFATLTRKPVMTASPSSIASLLLYQLWKMQLGVAAPEIDIKQAKYATTISYYVSTITRMIRPMSIKMITKAIWKDRSQK